MTKTVEALRAAEKSAKATGHDLLVYLIGMALDEAKYVRLSHAEPFR